jgi:hypothetical protein
MLRFITLTLLGWAMVASVCQGAGPTRTAAAATQPATTQATSHARVVLDEFFTALKEGDADNAIEFVATFGKPNDRLLRERLKRLAERRTVPTVLDLRETDRAAVAVVVEASTPTRKDIDPIYLIQRQGRFLVMPGLSRYRGGIVELTDEEEGDFQALEAWYNEQKATRK